MLRLLREYRAKETQSQLTMESLILDIVSAVAANDQNARSVPVYCWRLLLEKIHASFRESIWIRDLACAAGIHPVHVARLFRRYTGVTPGEYLQHLRVQHACRLMQEPERSLAEIASESGFVDQSHMNRVLRRFAHCSPGTLRELFLRESRHAGRAEAISGLKPFRTESKFRSDFDQQLKRVLALHNSRFRTRASM